MKKISLLIIILMLLSPWTFGQKNIHPEDILPRTKDSQKDLFEEFSKNPKAHSLPIYKSNQIDQYGSRSPRSFSHRMDSLIEYNWDSKWQDNYKETYTYDSYGNVTHVVYLEWDQGWEQWELYEKVEIKYTNDMLYDSLISLYWTGTDWLKSYLEVFSYNSSNLVSKVVSMNWDSNTETWLGNSKKEYTYTTNLNLSERVFYYWDFTSIAWEPSYKEDYTYDFDNLLIQEIDFNWDHMANQFQNSQKYEYFYNYYKDLTESFSYSWGFYSSQWENDRKYEYDYTNNGQINTELVWEWDDNSGAWELDRKHEYGFDSNGNPNLELYSYWTGGQFQYSSKYEYSYDLTVLLSNVMVGQYEFYPDYSEKIVNLPLAYIDYDYNGNSWEEDDKTKYFYSSINLDVFELSSEDILLYPNPTTDLINIQLNTETSPISIQIYNLSGQMVFEKNVSNHQTISLKHLPQGVYICILNSDSMSCTKKIEIF